MAYTEFPPTIEQKRYLQLLSLNPDIGSLTVPICLHWQGPLDKTLLKESVPPLIEHHQMLRAAFFFRHKPFMVQIHKNITWELIEKDFSLETSLEKPLDKKEQQEQEKKVNSYLVEIQRNSFDLEKGPLFRICLITRAPGKYLLLFCFHHLIADLRSVALFINQLLELYRKKGAGQHSELPPVRRKNQDFAEREKYDFTDQVLTERRGYWQKMFGKKELTLDLPYDFKRTARSGYCAAHLESSFSKEQSNKIQALARQEQVSLFSALFGAFNLALYAYTEQPGILTGVPLLNRNGISMRSTIGLFTYLAAVLIHPGEGETFRDYMARVNRDFKAVQKNILPFSEVSSILLDNNTKKHFPPVQAVFSYLPDFINAPQIPGVEISLRAIGRPEIDFDLFFYVTLENGLLRMNIDYLKNLFSQETMEEFIADYNRILELMLSKPDKPVAALFDCTSISKKQCISIAATFTAEPIEPALKFWTEKLHIRTKIAFAPFNQVFQQLLDPSSLFARKNKGANVVLLRLSDWCRTELDDDPALIAPESLQAVLDHNRQTFTSLAVQKNSGVPLLVVLCPEPPGLETNPVWQEIYREQSRFLEEELARPGHIYLLTGPLIEKWYPRDSYYDGEQDTLAHIPYKDEYFALLGTALSRLFYHISTQAFKVIVLDCDNTLWQGVVGEDGPGGIEISSRHRRFQQFIVEQKEAGKLITLCSKNNEQDVMEVFDRRQDMVLKKEHLAGWKINWNSKSHNILEMAGELGLGADSFIFIDDNPIEISEVNARLPQVLSLLFYGTDEAVEDLMKHCWPFDVFKVTEVDKQRTRMYQQSRLRSTSRKQYDSFEEFLKSLELEISIQPISREQVERISQLSFRTNQFNTTAVRRSSSQISTLLTGPHGRVLTVGVKDRFGDYGLSGAVFARQEKTDLVIDSLFLSCRVLGRGVEHRMIAALGELAFELHCEQLVIEYKESGKNEPVFSFLYSLGKECYRPDMEKPCFVIPRDKACALVFRNPEEPAGRGKTVTKDIRGPVEKVKKEGPTFSQRNRLLNEILEYFNRPVFIYQHVFENLKTVHKAQGTYMPPVTPSERKVVEIWEEVTGIDNIGISHDFFDIGGSSFDAVKILTALKEEFDIPVTHELLLHNTTVQALAAQVDSFLQEGTFLNPRADIPDLIQESVWPDDLVIDPGLALVPQQIEAVFITGATGYLGAYLVHELLTSTTAQVYCLVRADDKKSGLERIKNNLTSYHLWENRWIKRLQIVPGDFAEPNLGIEDGLYEELARSIDTIYHNGARVNFIFPYERLKKANVEGTLHVLRFAVYTKVKPVNYVSTNAVFDSLQYDSSVSIPERFVREDECHVIGGYARTKWVSERLITQAIERGLPAAIYRPSGISPADNPTARLQLGDALALVMLSCIELQAAPDFPAAVMDFSPVDYIARSIRTISTGAGNYGKVYHLNQPRPIVFKEFCRMISDFGYRLDMIPYSRWVEKVKTLTAEKKSKKLELILPIFEDKLRGINRTWFEAAMSRPRFDTANTREILKDTSISCPPLDYTQLLKYLYFAFYTNFTFFNKSWPPFTPPKKGKNRKRPKKILILSGSVGGGHNAISEFIKAYFSKRFARPNGEAEYITGYIKLEDYDPVFVNSTEIYNYIAKYNPALQDYVQDLLNEVFLKQYIVREEYKKELSRYIIHREEPDFVISVLSDASELAPYFKEYRPKVPFISAVADWRCECLYGFGTNSADVVYTQDDYTADYLIKNVHTNPDRIVEGSLMIGQEFFEPKGPADREQVLEKLGLDPALPTVLFNSYGTIQRFELLSSVLTEREAGEAEKGSNIANSLNAIVLCYGKEEVEQAVLDYKNNHYPHIAPVLWTDRLDTYLYAADAVYTKPGSGIIKESIIMNCPILLNQIDFTMPQERGAGRYVLENKLGFAINCREELKKTLDYLCDNSQEYRQVKENIEKITLTNGLEQLACLVEKLFKPGGE